MAALIFHGAPGSYKTSSAIWFELLGSLRKGRIVVTNIEGIKTKEQIESEMGETFPESAQLWRLSSQNENGRGLWRRYFHWCPIGAQIILDEVQDVFPNDRTFKPEKYEYKDVREYADFLPEEWIYRHIELLDSIKPDDLKPEDMDDTGTPIFNEHGHVIYPHTIRESFMRHRKYQWDIVVCTPTITEVHSLIRGACEHAYKHTSKDEFGKVIPYFKRRPRITQHPPKDSGNVAKKSDLGFYRKVPVKVHSLYKSTSTGKHNASGAGKSPLASPAILGILALVVFCLVYLGFAIPNVSNPAKSVVSANTEASSPTIAENSERVRKDSPFSRLDNTNQNDAETVSSLMLPHNPIDGYIVGSEIIKEGGRAAIEMYLRLVTKDGEYYLSSSDLKSYGYNIKVNSDCSATIRNSDIEVPIFCSMLKNKTTASTFSKPQVTIF